MPRSSNTTRSLPLNKRFLTLLATTFSIITLLSLLFSLTTTPSTVSTTSPHDSKDTAHPAAAIQVSKDTLKGGVISSKIGNATVKAELGRAAWKVLHTTMAKFPDKPTEDEQTALLSYLHLFARLYPCGECAQHFQQILKKYPPQVRTRSNAAAWACFVHNEVNKSLQKEEFDCSNIGDFYDCGCAEDEEEEGVQKEGGLKGKEGGKATGEVARETKRAGGESSGGGGGSGSGGGRIDVEVQRNGPTQGG